MKFEFICKEAEFKLIEIQRLNKKDKIKKQNNFVKV